MVNVIQHGHIRGMAARLALIAALTASSLYCARESTISFSNEDVQSSNVVADEISKERIMTRLKQISDVREKETPRNSYVSEHSVPFLGLETLALVKKTWEELGYTPVIEEDTIINNKVINAYIDILGSTPDAETVLVLAHFDSWGVAAVDNGAGVAVILELASVLKGLKLKSPVRLLVNDYEELQMLGIWSYLRHHPNDKYKLVLNLDMLGYTSEEEPSPLPSVAAPFADLPKKGDFLYLISNELSYPWQRGIKTLQDKIANLSPTLNVSLPKNGINKLSRALRITNSDHSILWDQNVSPALFFTTGSDRFPHYHTSTDTIDKINSDFLHQNARLVGAIVGAITGAVK